MTLIEVAYFREDDNVVFIVVQNISGRDNLLEVCLGCQWLVELVKWHLVMSGSDVHSFIDFGMTQTLRFWLWCHSRF